MGLIRHLRDVIAAWRFRRRFRIAHKDMRRWRAHVRAMIRETESWIDNDPGTERDSNLRFMDPEKEQARRSKG